MSWRATLSLAAWLGLMLAPAAAQQSGGDDLDTLQERALRAAVERVAPSVVQIETSGGTDVIGSGPALPNGPRGPAIRKGQGPTTGLVVAADGYVISSAFNFANKPSSIFVAVPGHKDRYVAKVVATDTTRMLTLLKIEANGLPVPEPTPRSAIQVGQTSLALGRTFDTLEHLPSVSAGIISALGRIWGKAIQTDAKVSPANYGGPLVDLYGRVLGVLVPASPRGEDETAGFEWYDSGIGFAIPLEDINAVLPRLKQGKDLHRGLLGVSPKSQDIYGPAPTVGAVLPGSAAARAGIQPGDVIKEVDGKPVANQAQLMHVLGTRYDGDIVNVKIQRGNEEKDLGKLTLGAPSEATAEAFLGILPMRDDPELGVEVRYVFPKGPADQAGLKEGDRITKIGSADGALQPFAGVTELEALLGSAQAGLTVKAEVVRKDGGKTETVSVKLGEMPDTVPETLPVEASRKKALEPHKTVGPQPPPAAPKKEEKEKKKPETGLVNRSNTAGDHQYWLYVPKDYDPNISYALVVWLHPVGKSKKQDMEDIQDVWEDYCKKNHLILLAPVAQNETGWVASEADFAQEVIREVMSTYTIDHRRVVAHGMGVGGQMAFYLGFHARDLIRGVATTGAAMSGQAKERLANEPLSFFLVVGSKDPLVKAVEETKTKLAEHKHPVVSREIKDMGHQYLDLKTLEELVRWIDSLDRI